MPVNVITSTLFTCIPELLSSLKLLTAVWSPEIVNRDDVAPPFKTNLVLLSEKPNRVTPDFNVKEPVK